MCPAVGRFARGKWLHVIMGSDIALACEAVASCFVAVLECIWGGSGGWIRGGSGVIKGDQGGNGVSAVVGNLTKHTVRDP